MARVAGTVFVKADSAQFDVTGGVECPLLPVKRETVMGVNGPAGYKETALEPYVKVTAVFGPDFPLATIQAATSLTVTAEYPNGKTYTLMQAFVKGEPAAKADDGTTELEFGGIQGFWN